LKTRSLTIIDASCNREKLQAFQQQTTVDYLINSHAHEDHLGGNGFFSEALLYAHPDEAPLLEDWTAGSAASASINGRKKRSRRGGISFRNPAITCHGRSIGTSRTAMKASHEKLVNP
jgi:glyoxylase-like metal-dependent hydrolase (beta-lactamase superfamily II)